MSDYSTDHWFKRIKEYLAADWSGEPTPFAVSAATYFQPEGKLLELGAGGGMDSLWFASQGFDVTMTDAKDFGFQEVLSRAERRGISLEVQELDMSHPFGFADASFDIVYAQLAVHYFNDQVTVHIIDEIKRVLKAGGVFACMVNSTKDPEYDAKLENSDHLVAVGSLMKRYFSLESFAPFVKDFEALVFDERGTSPKDDMVDTKEMIRFIGRKHEKSNS